MVLVAWLYGKKFVSHPILTFPLRGKEWKDQPLVGDSWF